MRLDTSVAGASTDILPETNDGWDSDFSIDGRCARRDDLSEASGDTLLLLPATHSLLPAFVKLTRAGIKECAARTIKFSSIGACSCLIASKYSGSSTVKVVPECAPAEDTVSVPPCCSTMPLAMNSPRPEPLLASSSCELN